MTVPTRLPFLPFLLTALTLGCTSEPSSTTSTQGPPVPWPAAARLSEAEVSDIVRRVRQGGVDVSMHSGVVDWPTAAKQGIGFAVVKATEGMDLKDSSFDAFWVAMKEVGLVRGAYHFYVTEDDPEAQARLFIDHVTLEAGDLAPIVDIELVGHGTPPGLTDRFRTFLRILEEHYDIRPIIYTSPKFWSDHLDDTFGDHPLWIAEYEVDAPRVPAGWRAWTLWQWEDDSDFSGVEKDADLDRVNPDLDDSVLAALVVTE